MPGSSASVAPFLQRLAALQPGQKAAAVNLGIFPDANAPVLASNSPAPIYTSYSAPVPTGVPGDRLASIDALLKAPPPATAPQPVQAAPRQVTQVAYSLPVTRQQTVRTSRAPVARRVWLQLASGSNPAEFADQFRRIKSRGEDMFDGIQGYVAKAPDRSRLVIGPFRNSTDAQTFADDLQDLHITAFSWTNSPSDTIVPLNDAG